MEIVFNCISFLSFIGTIALYFYYPKEKRKIHIVISLFVFVIFVLIGFTVADLFENKNVQKLVVSIFIFMTNICTYLIIQKTNVVSTVIQFINKHRTKVIIVISVLPIIFGLVSLICIRQTFSADKFDVYVDTNGADNYSLQSIDERSIIDIESERYEAIESDSSKTGDRSWITSKQTSDYDNVVYSSSEFNGVKVIQATKILSDKVVFEVDNTVSKGNCRISLIMDGEILHDFEINTQSEYTLKNTKGKEVFIVFAGEAATMNISISRNQSKQSGDGSVIEP